jgi:ribonuclease HI
VKKENKPKKNVICNRNKEILTINTENSCKNANGRLLRIYCDGSYSNNYDVGAWYYIILYQNTEYDHIILKRDGGVVENTNNVEMELLSVSKSLCYIRNLEKDNKISLNIHKIELYNDYLLISKLMNRSEIDNDKYWLRSDRKPIMHKELWYLLRDLDKDYNIDFHWIKGHSGDKFHDYCDKKAKELLVNKRNEIDNYNRRVV